MTESEERLVVAFERIASALEGIHEQARRTTNKLWPEREQREPVVTRIPTESDRAIEDQGGNDKRPIGQWISLEEEEGEEAKEFIGEREREFIERSKHSGPKAGGQAG